LQKLFKEEAIKDCPETITLAKFLLDYPSLAQKLQQKYQFRWVVFKQLTWRTHKEKRIIYNATHAIVRNEQSPIHFFILNNHNVLKQHIFGTCLNLPCLTFSKRQNNLLQHQQPLWYILGHNNNPTFSENDPQSTDELGAFLKEHTLPKTFVQVFFVHSFEKNHSTLWMESDLDVKQPLLSVIKIYAWTGPNYKTVYFKDPDASFERARKKGRKIEEQFKLYQEKIRHSKEGAKEDINPFQTNNSSCVNLSHSGLNLAYNLGLISTRQELATLSNALADTHASLYVFVDDKHHLRHITYYDKDVTFSVQVTCNDNDTSSTPLNQYQQGLNDERSDKAAKTMLEFWQKIWKRRQYWINQREALFLPLTKRLVNFQKKPASPFTRCEADLKTMTKLQHLYIYSSQESHLHAIKYYLADFAYKTLKRCKGVTIKAQSDGTLTMLNIPGLTIINLHTYFGTKSDSDFFSPVFHNSGYNPSSTVVSHKTKDLKRQTFPGKLHTTMWMHCKQTGKECAKHLLEYWKTFGRMILEHFFFEVHGLVNLPSASYLAFQCIWTAYIKKAGPMVQGLEKCKSYYEDLLRENSKGGFMYSIEDALNQGETLWPNIPDSSLAETIAELDLVSAYGFSASQTYMPSGFCTGYGKVKPSGHSLEKLDKKSRHNTFEFRAVYRVLHHISVEKKEIIRSVYSNFSPLGLFYLGSYPIDLAVVLESGHLLLFQMDGQWTHGCPDQCQPLKHYANGQSYEQVRAKTNLRDKVILEWRTAMMLQEFQVEYEIIYDCHSEFLSEYSGTFLETQFQNKPELAQLVKSYQRIESLGNSLTPQKLEYLIASAPDNDFTFIAKARLQVASHPHELIPPGGPLVVYEHRHDKYTRQSLSYNGSVVLTRDYYEWLKNSFDTVLVQELEWVLFYKTEPIFNEIYQNLIQSRSVTKDPVHASFLKRMINLSCGFYGAHTSQQNKTTYRLVDGPPSNYQFFRHHLNMDYTGDVGQNGYLLLETKMWPKKSSYRKASSSAIPMFLCIIEYGKLRLIQVLNFLQRHIAPTQFRLLYSNIDNLVFALGNANTLQESVHPFRMASFHAEKHQFLVEEEESKTPGKAELEWIRQSSSGWKFISVRTQHYCLVVSHDHDQGHLHKTSGWSHLSSVEAYELAKEMLGGKQVKVIQTRRVNKKCNMDTHQVEFMY